MTAKLTEAEKAERKAARAAAKATPAKPAEKESKRRVAKPINVGSTWKRRHDGVDVVVQAVDEKAGTVSTLSASAKKAGKDATTSNVKYFRRRFQHVKG